MATTERRSAVANRATRRTLATIGEELLQARLGAGLSQAAVGAGCGMSRSKVGRIERGQAPSASVADLNRALAIVGLELAIRAFPTSQPLRDIAHLRLLADFAARIDPRLTIRTEVPLPTPGDRRAWDGMITGATAPAGDTWPVALEAETRLRDVQALLRRIALKQRDSGVGVVVLLVRDTRSNRAALREAHMALVGAFPLDCRTILDALAAGKAPPANGIVLI